MDYSLFVKKYDRPELAACDIILQKASSFGDECRMIFIYSINFYCALAFRDGVSFLGLKGRCIFLICRKSSEIKIIRPFLERLEHDYNRYSHEDKVIILALENDTKNIKLPKNHLLFDYDIIEKDTDSYIPLNYDMLLSNALRSKKKQSGNTSNNNQTDNSNKPIDIDEKVSSRTADEISKNNREQYNKFFIDNSAKCAFILGNGISIPFGADPWDKLISNLIDYLSPYYIKNADVVVKALSKSNYLISSFVKSTFEEKGQMEVYNAGLKYCIYRKFNEGMLNDDSLLKAVALAKINNPDLAIFTYNYDDFLESQIAICDKSFKIKPFSGKTYQNHISDSVIHLHGTIKEKSKTIDKDLVLTDKEYFKAYLANNDSWVYDAQYDALSNYKCLYIGSSMSDLFQLSIVEKAQSKLGNNWSCYALMCFEGLENKEKTNLISFYSKKGIKIIFVNSYDKLANELNLITGCSFSKSAPAFGKK